MEASGELEFVNRGAELAFLESGLLGQEVSPALIVIRAPAGFGKSRLTDQLSARMAASGLKFCIVDPNIRARVGATRLHDGYFLQRCAEKLSAMGSGEAEWPGLRQFLRNRRWRTAVEKKPTDTISELPSFAHAYRVVFDYASRLFGFGRFSPEQLLVSDQSEAIRLCQDYAVAVLPNFPLVLVVREAQHIDIDSLRTLLQINLVNPNPRLIFEYTTESGEFEPEHQKSFIRVAETHKEFSILDLVRLEPGYLEYLIRKNVNSNFDLTSDFYLSWNGNLRSIIELKFQVAIGRRITSPRQIEHVLGNFQASLEEHIAKLPSLERLILSVTLANVEAIDHRILAAAVAKINPRVTTHMLQEALRQLIDMHGFISEISKSYRIQNETVAVALTSIPAIRLLDAAAEAALRDHYARLIKSSAQGEIGIAAAVRQLFRLCARTKDAAGLLHAVDTLSTEVKASQDQTVYVDAVAAAVEADPELYSNDYDELVTWAASLAYDVCDWERASRLMAFKKGQDVFSYALRACSLQEIGKHDEALSLSVQIREHARRPNEHLAADLIEAIVIGCRGQHDESRRILNNIISNTEFRASPLLGYAHRFFEVIAGSLECLDHLRASAEWFGRFGFQKSRAYSQLPAAVLLARMGDIAAARALIAEAEQTLADEVRDQHLILNNRIAIDLLEPNPDFSTCVGILITALRYARDDYSELTILNNLALSYWGEKNIELALDCIDRVIGILNHHDFAEQDVYWPACFNAGEIFAASGQAERRDEIRRFPLMQGRAVAINPGYWAYRYGQSSAVEDHYRFLAGKPYHPLYLSHWTIDLDGLSLLK